MFTKSEYYAIRKGEYCYIRKGYILLVGINRNSRPFVKVNFSLFVKGVFELPRSR